MKNSPYYLFLDDQRFPKDVTWIDLPLFNWTIVRSYSEFVKIIAKRGLPKFVSYDHDIGEEAYRECRRGEGKEFKYSNLTEKTGYDCCKYLIEACLDRNVSHPDYSVHSLNPIGAENIKKLIDNFNAQNLS